MDVVSGRRHSPWWPGSVLLLATGRLFAETMVVTFFISDLVAGEGGGSSAWQRSLPARRPGSRFLRLARRGDHDPPGVPNGHRRQPTCGRQGRVASQHKPKRLLI